MNDRRRSRIFAHCNLAALAGQQAARLVRQRGPRSAVAADARPVCDLDQRDHAPADAGGDGRCRTGSGFWLAFRRAARWPRPTSTKCCGCGKDWATIAARGNFMRPRGKSSTEHDGQFPKDFDAVRSLPGIGRYTAGAILSIGLDQRLPILEANTIRVLSRLTALSRRCPLDRRPAASVVGGRGDSAAAALRRVQPSADGAGQRNLHAALAGVRSLSRCAACARRISKNLVGKIPRPAKRTKYEDVTEVAVVIRRGDRVVLRHCQPGERWAGLWDFPRFAADQRRSATARLQRQIVVADARPRRPEGQARPAPGHAQARRHAFSHHAALLRGRAQVATARVAKRSSAGACPLGENRCAGRVSAEHDRPKDQPACWPKLA